MAFTNKIRLPLQLHSPQFPEERRTFRKANGVTKTVFAIVRKTYQLETDWMPELWHQRTKIALAHDTVSIEGDRYLGYIAPESDYTIEWLDTPLRYPTAKASSVVQVTPFDATNSNCQTCVEATQLNLVDDEATALYGDPLQEDTDYAVDVADNDLICCFPAEFSLVSYNADYLTSATIDASTGVLSIHTASDVASINGLLIATYRVTCPNGGYDEADVYANIEGSLPALCLAPLEIVFSNILSTSLTATWYQDPLLSNYYWELYEGTEPIGSPIQTGSTATNTVDISGLDSSTEYYFQVRSVCDESTTSIFVGIGFTTASDVEESCGRYSVSYFDPTNMTPTYAQGWEDCNGNTQYVIINNGNTSVICANQLGPGNPTLLMTSNPNVTITYIGPC